MEYVSPDTASDWDLFGGTLSLEFNNAQRNEQKNTSHEKNNCTLESFLLSNDSKFLDGSLSSDFIIEQGLVNVATSPINSSRCSPIHKPESTTPDFDVDFMLNTHDIDFKDFDIPSPDLSSSDPNEFNNILDSICELSREENVLSSSNNCYSESSINSPPNSFQDFCVEEDLLSEVVALNDLCQSMDDDDDDTNFTVWSERTCPNSKTKKCLKPLEKRIRKKDQNRDAAVRYRQKKKILKDVVGMTLEQLEEKNKMLKSLTKEKTREIDYLKELLRDVCKLKKLAIPSQIM